VGNTSGCVKAASQACCNNLRGGGGSSCYCGVMGMMNVT